MVAPPNPTELRIEVERISQGDGGLAIVVAKGEVDLGNSGELAQALRSEIGAGVNGIVLDLTGIGFMDSSGLRVILVAVSEFEPNISLVVTPDSPPANLLDLTALTDRVQTYTDRDQAIAATEKGTDGDA